MNNPDLPTSPPAKLRRRSWWLLGVCGLISLIAYLGFVWPEHPEHTASKSSTSPHKLEALVIEPSPVVDEQLFLLTALEGFYSNWPIVDLKIPNPELDRLADLKRKGQEFETYLGTGTFDPELLQIYREFIETTDAHFRFLEEAGAIKDAHHTELGKAAGAVALGGIATGWGLAEKIDHNDGSSSGREKVLVGVAALLMGLYEAVKSEDDINERRKGEITAATKRFADQLDHARQNAQGAAINLAATHSWKRPEAGFELGNHGDEQMNRLENERDLPGLLQFLREKERVRPRDPFAKGYAIQVESEIGKQHATAENYVGWAEQFVDAAKLVPRPSIYDPYRRLFLRHAGDMALIAARKQLGDRGFRSGPVEGGERAVVYWKTVLKLDPSDAQGVGRWNLGVGLAHAGGLVDAAKTLREIKDLYSGNAEYHYMLARMDSCLGDQADALAHLKSALENGYSNVPAARTDADFELLHAKLPRETENLLALKYHWDVNYGYLWDDIILTNDSAFTITNVALRAEVANSHRTCRPHPDPLRVNSLAPGKSYKWTNCMSIDFGKKTTDTKSATIECAQGNR